MIYINIVLLVEVSTPGGKSGVDLTPHINTRQITTKQDKLLGEGKLVFISAPVS